MQKVERFIIAIPISFSLLVAWFSWSAFQAAPQMAAENLRGAALSTAAAIGQLASVDTGFVTLSRYSTPDIAYFSLTDTRGIIRFHTNPALTGIESPETMPMVDRKSGILEGRKKLGTGEVIYLLQTYIHAAGGDYLLNLALHTYRADLVIRRAQTGVVVVGFLTVSLWIVTLGIMYLLRRDARRQREMLRREELARLGELGAVMAHEIRNPLAGIKGFAQLVETAGNMEQARHYAERIVRQSLQMEALVNNLLAFAREDRGERHPADLDLLVRDNIALIGKEAEAAGVDIVRTDDITVKIMVATDRINQLLLNLFKNAIEAMPDGGVLQIELERASSYTVMRVRDSGTGITPENLKHIFEPFWTSKARGTGLGLALCRKIAEEHGGSLTVQSDPGVGTMFALTLPMEG